MLVDHLHLDSEKITTVADGELLSLGDRTLEFIHTPWVHWPETMLIYMQDDKILFTCDLFGAHLATTELYGKNKVRVYEAAKRYYAEIMMPFHAIIKKHLKKFNNYEFNLIAPSHGPLYDDPGFILDAYRTFLVGPYPTIVHTAYLTAILRPKLRYAAVINSYGRSGTAVEQIIEITKNLKIEWFDPVMTKGLPDEATWAELDRLAEMTAEKHQEV